ncbi:glucose-6-phosphate isomerase [Flavobacterium silvaticum]|uniref:Glucose-6-phosphate isomerase n=1 Tax=Flavobacterium silvaticum TaxID=1852020 RepID=A0A972FKW2_9FLAO|nr:glucose-6-phosphate isomerase [Flavobacterium silvaticum]NMH27618.1 glucose-6-phosphate isomerase [Flavobacterium silvaticum]
MSLAKLNPTQTAAWKKLESHFNENHHLEMKHLFAQDLNRANEFSIQFGDFFLDYSKNRISSETIKLLLELANECGLDKAIESYFKGDLINQTENRAVLHTALRVQNETPVLVDGQDVIPEIRSVQQKMEGFTAEVISGSRKGFTGKAFTDVVNVGIGGSDLGPDMVVEALKFYKNQLNAHFVSNIDGDHVNEILSGLNPETTLFVIVSKTFTTQETLTNAETIRKWFLKSGTQQDVAKHFVAVSTNIKKVTEFGIAEENIFPMWDWVGGRFSLWSAVGLTIALAVGYDNFDQLLKGANRMDEHFKSAKHSQNIPVVLALVSIWYNNFYKSESEAIIPYSQYLKRLSAYLQQGVMESNGKDKDRNGNAVNYQTGTIVWGEPGSNSQHAFFQLIHQGTKLIPVDFIGFKRSLHGDQDHHNKLMSNFFAQTEALLNGKNTATVNAEFAAQGISGEQADFLRSFKEFAGNKPTNTLLIDKLTPESLGALIAMYEHKIFVQGVIWNIFSFDQWGVELGKQLANVLLSEIESKNIGKHDSSTTNLLKHFLDA